MRDVIDKTSLHRPSGRCSVNRNVFMAGSVVIALIACIDNNRLIGIDGKLPWHLPADLAHFRRLTMGHAVVMGRRTYESIGGPLGGRTNIVLSRARDGVPWRESLAEAIEEAGDVFVIGGADVFAQALPVADSLCLTRIRHTFPVGEGAVYFPEWDGFRLAASKHREADAQNPWPMDFETWERA